MNLRADLSGPVLAILVTIAVIAAGIGLMAYFWWVAPTASKMPTLSVIGEPALSVSTDTVSVYISLKNVGSEAITVEKLVIVDDEGTALELTPSTTTIGAGQKASITFSKDVSGTTVKFTNPVYGATLVTDGGVIPINVYLITQQS